MAPIPGLSADIPPTFVEIKIDYRGCVQKEKNLINEAIAGKELDYSSVPVTEDEINIFKDYCKLQCLKYSDMTGGGSIMSFDGKGKDGKKDGIISYGEYKEFEKDFNELISKLKKKGGVKQQDNNSKEKPTSAMFKIINYKFDIFREDNFGTRVLNSMV